MVKWLSGADKAEISRSIAAAEKNTTGEIRVHIKRSCGADALSEAKRTFKRLGMHRTKEKNGVLIFVAPDSHRFAIVGDAGIHAGVGADFWEAERDGMAAYFAKGEFTEGLVATVRRVGERLKKHFPAERGDRNELSDEVTQN